MREKGLVQLLLLVTVFIAVLAFVAYTMTKDHINDQVIVTTAEGNIELIETPTTINTPTLSPTPQIQFSFTVPTGWTAFNYNEYKNMDLKASIPNNGRIAVADNDKECIYYAGTEWRGRGGPSNIYDNTEVTIDDTQFTLRSWFREEGGLPFFRYYFPSDHSVTMYSWITDQNCMTDVDTIVDSFKFE